MGLIALGARIQQSPTRCGFPSAARWQRLDGDVTGGGGWSVPPSPAPLCDPPHQVWLGRGSCPSQQPGGGCGLGWHHLHSVSGSSFSRSAHQWVGWGWARGWQGTPADRGGIPRHTMSCSAIKAQGKKEERGRSGLWRWPSQPRLRVRRLRSPGVPGQGPTGGDQGVNSVFSSASVSGFASPVKLSSPQPMSFSHFSPSDSLCHPPAAGGGLGCWQGQPTPPRHGVGGCGQRGR